MAERRYALIGHTHAASGAAVWGGITGTLSDQTDLQAELDLKSNTSHNHAGVYEPVDATLVRTTDAGYNNLDWDDAATWGDHATAGYALATQIANSPNWDTAFGWGDHASAGYRSVAESLYYKSTREGNPGLNLDTAVTQGIYRLHGSASHVGHPAGLGYGFAVVLDNSDVHGHILLDRADDGRMYIRAASSSDFTAIGWNQVYTDADFDIADYALLSGATFTGGITTGGRVQVNGTSIGGAQGSSLVVKANNPQFSIEDSDSGVDEKVFNWVVSSGKMSLRTLSDDYASSTEVMEFDRVGNTVPHIEVNAGMEFTVVGSNTAPGLNSLNIGGYGIMGDRGTMYVTNANATGAVQIGAGGAHNVNPVATFSYTGDVNIPGTLNNNALNSAWDSTAAGYAVRHSSGYLKATYFNQPVTSNTATVPSHVPVMTGGTDGYYRWQTLTKFIDHLQGQIWDFTSQPTARYGIDGGYSTTGGGNDFGATIWSIDGTWAGGTSGADSAITNMYGLKWLRQTHVNARAVVNEGLYLYVAGTERFSAGVSGIYTAGVINLGNTTDTTISRVSAGKLEVENKPILNHASSTYNSGQVTFSTSAPSGGSDGDIWFEY